MIGEMILLIILSIPLGLTFVFLLATALIANGMAMSNRVKPVWDDKRGTTVRRDVSFKSRVDGIRISAWYLQVPNAGNLGTVVVMHGGKQNRSEQRIGLLQ